MVVLALLGLTCLQLQGVLRRPRLSQRSGPAGQSNFPATSFLRGSTTGLAGRQAVTAAAVAQRGVERVKEKRQ